MKIFFGLILLIGCTYSGYFLSQKCTRRKNYYSNFYRFNKQVLNEVSFGKKSIISILSEKKEKNEFYDLLEYSLNKKKVLLPEKIFNEDDATLLNEYCSILGSGDSLSQKRYLSGIDDRVEIILKECTETEKRYKNLYVKMGFFIGLMIFIIII